MGVGFVVGDVDLFVGNGVDQLAEPGSQRPAQHEPDETQRQDHSYERKEYKDQPLVGGVGTLYPSFDEGNERFQAYRYHAGNDADNNADEYLVVPVGNAPGDPADSPEGIMFGISEDCRKSHKPFVGTDDALPNCRAEYRNKYNPNGLLTPH